MKIRKPVDALSRKGKYLYFRKLKNSETLENRENSLQIANGQEVQDDGKVCEGELEINPGNSAFRDRANVAGASGRRDKNESDDSSNSENESVQDSDVDMDRGNDINGAVQSDRDSGDDEPGESLVNNEINRDNNHREEIDSSGEEDDGEEPVVVEEEDIGEEPEGLEEEDEEGEDDEGENDIDEVNNNGDQPLYAGASMTVADSMLLLLTILLKHNITGTCLADFISVINMHCPNAGLKKNSLYKFKKYFLLSRNDTFTKHYYCSKCTSPLNSANEVCPECNRQNEVSYFIELPFLKQLEELFKRDGFHNLLQHRFNREARHGTFSDIYDGSQYKTFVENGFLSNPNNISLMWNTDGVPVFKSSKISMWPFYLSICELEYKHRIKRENTLLAGLWFGSKKPAANNFIYSFRREFESLYRGINFTLQGGNVINVKGVLLAGTCDLPAKAQFFNMMQFNGEFGCLNCLNKGETFNHKTGGNSHVYRYSRNIVLRTSHQTNLQAAEALRNEKVSHVMGVKGPSAFSKLMPDFIKGTGIDFMHCIFCGVVKKLLSLWFTPSYRKFNFSLIDVQQNIDARLVKIKPPKYVHRMPRTVSDLCHWKASELKMWFFYYSVPVLEGIMRADYFQHYLRLVSAISILNSQCITQEQLGHARNLLHRFVSEFEELYHLQFCTINIHQLLHLPDCVQELGPLWGFSCFPYENLNGKLLNLVHGTSHLDSQIASAHSQLLKMQRKLEQLDDGPVHDFCIKFKNQVKICERIFSSCYSVGYYNKLIQLPHIIEQAMNYSQVPLGNSIQVYSRLLKDSKLFVSEAYTRSVNTISSYSTFKINDEEKLGSIHSFVKISRCQCIRKCLCPGDHYAIVSDFNRDESFQVYGNRIQVELSYLHKCHRTGLLRAVPVSQLGSVCVYMYINSQSYIGKPVNDNEIE